MTRECRKVPIIWNFKSLESWQRKFSSTENDADFTSIVFIEILIILLDISCTVILTRKTIIKSELCLLSLSTQKPNGLLGRFGARKHSI